MQLAEERKLNADAEAKFLRIDRVDNDTLSKTKTKVPGKTGSLLGIAEFWTEGNKAKSAKETSTSHPSSEMESLKTPSVNLPPSFANETSTPRPRSEMESLKTPSIILPPSFKRRASVLVRPEVNETTRAQPMAKSDYNIPNEENNGPEAKRSRSIPNEVVRETQGRDNQTEAQARDNHTDKDFAKPRIRVSSNINRQGQQEKSGKKPPLSVDLPHLCFSLRLNLLFLVFFLFSDFHGHDELIALIGRSSLRATIETRTVGMVPSCHTKRVRSLALSPSNRELFATR